jgi:hypothetical protein
VTLNIIFSVAHTDLGISLKLSGVKNSSKDGPFFQDAKFEANAFNVNAPASIFGTDNSVLLHGRAKRIRFTSGSSFISYTSSKT